MFRRVADHLRIVRVRDVGGNIETIRTTDEHPFWVSGIGWVAARNLKGGQRLNEADDSGDAVVLSSIREEHPEGIAVYNFEVEGDHTYFVEDGIGQQTAVWVHNTCAGLNHLVPRALGSSIPYGDDILTQASVFGHTHFHQRLWASLSRVTKTLPDGRVVDMLPRAGNPGAVIRQNFTAWERFKALRAFYREYSFGGRSLYNEFIAEMRETLRRGAFQ